MMRNLKALGLLAFAALAMSAMFASAAQAQNGVLTAGHNEEPPVHTKSTIVGEQYPTITENSTPEEVAEWNEWNFFKATPDGDAIQCDWATLTGTTEGGTAKDIKVAADYDYCGSGNQDVTVSMNGCEYLLTQPTKLPVGEYTGNVDLTCPEHNRIEIKVFASTNPTNTSDFFSLCTIEVYPAGEEEVEGHTIDELGGHIIYENIDNGATEDDVTATVTAEGITTKDGCNNEHHTNGVYSSTVTVKAFEDEVEPHTEQFDLWITDEEV